MSNEITPGKPVRIYQQDGYFKDFSTEDIVVKKLNSFLGWKCGAGVENICINFDGDIQSASCGVPGPKSKNGVYGNIFKDFGFEEKWITCPFQYCSCGADLFIPKAKEILDKDLLELKNDTGKDFTAFKVNELSDPRAVERTFFTKNKQVLWEIGRRCNYDCSYCHPYIHNNFEPHKTLRSLIEATEKLEKFSKGQKINFSISGGEPTLNPDYMNWVKYLVANGHHVSTHSNGSRNPEYYVDLIRYSDLNLSVHFEFYKKNLFIDVVTAVVNEIYVRSLTHELSGNFEVMIMSQPNQENLAFEFEKELWKIPHFSKFCNLNIMPIRGHESIENKTDMTGNQLLSDYSEDNLKKYGTKTIEMFISEVSNSNEEEFSKYDQLDGIDNHEARFNIFKSIQ